MRHLPLLLVALGSCNQWTRPAPKLASLRQPEGQMESAVAIDVVCKTGSGWEHRHGSGVIVTDWQVLTALHVVDCFSAPSIRVTSERGTWGFLPEKEWRDLDVARIQMASNDSLGSDISPPFIRYPQHPWRDDQLYLSAGSPVREEMMGYMAHSFGGNSYGGSTKLAYQMDTREGNSGSGVYDIGGALIAIHIGRYDSGPFGVYVTPEMVPGN